MIVGANEFILRILVSAVLGALVGIERERHNQPAGLRTQMILAVGATLAMILSINLAFQFIPAGGSAGDPSRLAAQVVSGIGFLGAGAILHYGANVKGLTTATSLWAIAIVGLTVGAGYYLIGVVTVGLMLLILSLLTRFEHRFIQRKGDLSVTVDAVDHPGLVEELIKQMGKDEFAISATRIQKNLETNQIQMCFEIHGAPSNALDTLIGRVSRVTGVINFKIE